MTVLGWIEHGGLWTEHSEIPFRPNTPEGWEDWNGFFLLSPSVLTPPYRATPAYALPLPASIIITDRPVARAGGVEGWVTGVGLDEAPHLVAILAAALLTGEGFEGIFAEAQKWAREQLHLPSSVPFVLLGPGKMPTLPTAEENRFPPDLAYPGYGGDGGDGKKLWLSFFHQGWRLAEFSPSPIALWNPQPSPFTGWGVVGMQGGVTWGITWGRYGIVPLPPK